jgi:hypothetical protein
MRSIAAPPLLFEESAERARVLAETFARVAYGLG